MPGKTDDNRREPVLLGRQPIDLRDGDFERVAVEPGRRQRPQRTRERSGRVADRHTDPPLADIKPDDSCHAV